MGMGIRAGRPRCPDFEERGFCLRGDLCPLEHGANRIVVEDVQVSPKYIFIVSIAFDFLVRYKLRHRDGGRCGCCGWFKAFLCLLGIYLE
jgi:hypothetical protein